MRSGEIVLPAAPTECRASAAQTGIDASPLIDGGCPSGPPRPWM
ncbi:MAG TPA: hypothetical protein VEC38_07435 [Candidatus Binataceae bacterium]|nr:hypothetical protein [Candidatus Binataceae bacterium]